LASRVAPGQWKLTSHLYNVLVLDSEDTQGTSTFNW